MRTSGSGDNKEEKTLGSTYYLKADRPWIGGLRRGESSW